MCCTHIYFTHPFPLPLSLSIPTDSTNSYLSIPTDSTNSYIGFYNVQGFLELIIELSTPIGSDWGFQRVSPKIVILLTVEMK